MSDTNRNAAEALSMNRRGFLRDGSLLGGILAAQTFPAITRAETKSADALNVAIIGTGEQGQALLKACRGLPNIRFKAAADIWEYNRRRGMARVQALSPDAKSYGDFEEMLAEESDLDAVIVATPDFVHHKHTIACLEAGLNVYCEKLMSNSLENARLMVETAQKTGKLLQIGHQRRSNPRYHHVYEQLIEDANLFGRISAVNAQWNRAVSKDFGAGPEKYQLDEAMLQKYGYENMHQFRNWRWFKRLGGGPISDLGAHQIDIFNWFLRANPSSVLASGGVDFYKTHEWEDNVMAIYEYPIQDSVVRAFYQVQTTTSAGGGYFEYFMGTEGAIRMSENPRYTRLFREAHAPSWNEWISKGSIKNLDPKKEVKAWELPKPVKIKGAGGAGTVDSRETAALDEYQITTTLDRAIHQPHLENFFDAIRGKCKLNCSGEVAFASTNTILAVNEAIEAEKKLTFDSDSFTI
jgi:predicted dehydrogenase